MDSICGGQAGKGEQMSRMSHLTPIPGQGLSSRSPPSESAKANCVIWETACWMIDGEENVCVQSISIPMPVKSTARAQPGCRCPVVDAGPVCRRDQQRPGSTVNAVCAVPGRRLELT